MILNKAKDYYENDKGRLRDQEARDKYRNLSEEEKKKVIIWKKQISYVWRKETKTKKNIKKLPKKSKYIINNKIVLIVHAVTYANILTEMKAK